MKTIFVKRVLRIEEPKLLGDDAFRRVVVETYNGEHKTLLLTVEKTKSLLKNGWVED